MDTKTQWILSGARIISEETWWSALSLWPVLDWLSAESGQQRLSSKAMKNMLSSHPQTEIGVNHTCSDKGPPVSTLWLATFPAITFASVSRIMLHEIHLVLASAKTKGIWWGRIRWEPSRGFFYQPIKGAGLQYEDNTRRTSRAQSPLS